MNTPRRGLPAKQAASSQQIGEMQVRQQREDFQIALRALLMRPLLGPAHKDFASVRRQADKLREWFARETGWPLAVERDGARLFKRPADTSDPTRGLRPPPLRVVVSRMCFSRAICHSNHAARFGQRNHGARCRPRDVDARVCVHAGERL